MSPPSDQLFFYTIWPWSQLCNPKPKVTNSIIEKLWFLGHVPKAWRRSRDTHVHAKVGWRGCGRGQRIVCAPRCPVPECIPPSPPRWFQAISAGKKPRRARVVCAGRDLPWIYPSASVLLGYSCPAQFTNCFRLPMLRVLRVLRLPEVFRGLETHFNCISFNGNISGSSLPPSPIAVPLGCLSVWATVWRSDGLMVWWSDILIPCHVNNICVRQRCVSVNLSMHMYMCAHGCGCWGVLHISQL